MTTRNEAAGKGAGAFAAFVVVACLFFAWGFVTSNNDPLIAAMRCVYTLDVAEAMLTQFAFFLAYFFVSLPAAALLARMGHSRTIITALLVMVGACLLVQVASSFQQYALVLIALFVMASGITALQVAANPLAASLGAPETSSFRLTFAQAINSLGVVLGSSIGSRIMLDQSVLERSGCVAGATATGFSRTAVLDAVDHAFVLIAIAVAALAVLIFAFRRRIDIAAGDSVIENASPLEALRSGWALFGALAIFLYVGAEVTIGSVMITFLNRPDVLNVPMKTAGDFYLAYLYWGGALVGRFIGSWLLTRVRAHHLLSAAAAVAACLAVGAFLLKGPPAAYAALGVGFFNSIMFPTIFTLTLARSRASSASISGLLCMAIVGGAAIPYLSGRLGEAAGLHATFLLPAIAYIGILIFAVAGRVRRPGPEDEATPVLPH